MSLGQFYPGLAQRAACHFFIAHTVFDDMLDLLALFHRVRRLFQLRIVQDTDHVGDRALHGFSGSGLS